MSTQRTSSCPSYTVSRIASQGPPAQDEEGRKKKEETPRSLLEIMSAYPYSLLPPTATTAFADSSSPTVSPAGSTSADAAAAGTGERTLAGTAARARNHLIDLSSASSSSSSSSSTELEVPGYADADAEEHPVSSYASTSTSDSYDSSGESLDRIAIAPFSTSTSSASTRDAASGRAGSLSSSARRAAAGLPAGTNEKEDYYSTEAWEGYRPELIMYRKGSNNAAVSSRRSSRHASGTTTPVASEKLEREGVCKHTFALIRTGERQQTDRCFPFGCARQTLNLITIRLQLR